MASEGMSTTRTLVAFGVIGVFGLVTLALAAATLGVLSTRLSKVDDKLGALELALTTANTTTMRPATTTPSTTTARPGTTTTPTSTVTPAQNASLVTSVNADHVMQHLRELQAIADASNGTRAVNTIGFNRTVEYIKRALNQTNFKVHQSSFPVKDFALNSNPVFIVTTDGDAVNYNYSSDPQKSDFFQGKYSVASDVSINHEVVVIPNGGCADDDWASKPNDRVALVKRDGTCAFRDRAALAMKYNFAGVLFYNNGQPGNMAPIEVNLAQNNTLFVLFLSYAVGDRLAKAVDDPAVNVTVKMGIELKNLPDFYVANICADTLSGDANQTILVGSHSDSVLAGAGINDNGSGSGANLALAIALYQLFQASADNQYKYRVRFCWWGAEEIGLLGSKYHAEQAKNATEPGERLQDYLINFNYDMIGSPNFIFGIYDGETAKNGTSDPAKQGSIKVSKLFSDWFEGQQYPWNYTELSGRSDYGPFLEEGIAAGGLFSGGDGIKTTEQRDQYAEKLNGMGGSAGVAYDPCYHKACDSIHNINRDVLDKLTKGAAYALEYLGKQADLKTWLYPNGTFFENTATN